MSAYSTFIPANITPTVELNALAMKRGEPATYTVMETTTTTPPATTNKANLNFRGMHNQRYATVFV